MKDISKIITICLLLIVGILHAEDKKMNDQEAQKTWNEYHERIKNRRLAQAAIINKELKKNGITTEIDLMLDFTFFAKEENDAKNLQKQLSENYEISINKKEDYWFINATSRPYAVNFTTQQHMDWVEFMHDVALSHGSIFSVWTITNHETKQVWSNENISTEYD